MTEAPRTQVLTLRFRDPGLERAFQEDALPASVRQSRRAILAVAVLWTAGWLLRLPLLMSQPGELLEVSGLLAVANLPGFWACFAFTFHRAYGRLLAPTVAVACFSYWFATLGVYMDAGG